MLSVRCEPRNMRVLAWFMRCLRCTATAAIASSLATEIELRQPSAMHKHCARLGSVQFCSHLLRLLLSGSFIPIILLILCCFLFFFNFLFDFLYFHIFLLLDPFFVNFFHFVRSLFSSAFFFFFSSSLSFAPFPPVTKESYLTSCICVVVCLYLTCPQHTQRPKCQCDRICSAQSHAEIRRKQRHFLIPHNRRPLSMARFIIRSIPKKKKKIIATAVCSLCACDWHYCRS